MIAKTYTNSDSANTVNKNLVFKADIEIKFKDEVNIYNPLIMLKYGEQIITQGIH